MLYDNLRPQIIHVQHLETLAELSLEIVEDAQVKAETGLAQSACLTASIVVELARARSVPQTEATSGMLHYKDHIKSGFPRNL